MTMRDINGQEIREGSRVIVRGQLGEEDRDQALYEGIAVRGDAGWEVVIERCLVKQDDPPWRVEVDGFVLEVVLK